MSNVESHSVAEAMGSADRRVNANVADIPMEQRAKIAMTEQSIKDAMRAPNWSEIKDRYMKDRSTNKQDPEAILATAKMHFDRVQATEDQYAGEQLRALAAMALGQLSELKDDLGYSVTVTADATRDYADTISRMTGADRTITATPAQPENMSSVEQILGIQPREKLEARTSDVVSALEDLKRPENMTAFMNAKVDYASLTGGLSLQDAIPTLDKAFKDGLEALQKKHPDAQTLRREAMALVEKQLKGLSGLWTLITMHVREAAGAAIPKAHAEVSTHAEATHEGSESETLSDEEMAEVMQFLLEDFRGKQETGAVKMPTTISEGLETYYQVVPAYQYYYKKATGEAPKMDEMSMRGGALLGTAQGALNVLVGLDQLGVGMVSYAGEKAGLVKPTPAGEKAEGLGVQVLNTLGKLMKGATYENFKNMLGYGWNNSTAAEKVYLLNKIVTEYFVGNAAYGAILDAAKFKNMGTVGQKLVKMASTPAVKQVAALMETVAISCPGLAKFGMTTEKIVLGLEKGAKEALHVWDHYVIHGVHVVDEANQVREVVYEPTVGKYNEKVEEIEASKKTEHGFATEEMKEIQRDLSAALASADKLQLKTTDIAELKSEKAEVDKRLGAA